MFKHLKLATALLLVTMGFAACSDDDPAPAPSTPYVPGTSAFYVVNQGNSYSNIAGSIDGFTFTENDTVQASGIFSAANGQSLGNSPQKPIIYGSKMYVPMYAENLVWVIDATSMKKIASVQTNAPETICGSNGYVFVTNNDGNVTRIDTISYTPSAPLAVGPNPSGITATKGKVYAAISDGYNGANGYVNGFKVAQIDAENFTIDKNITVGMNPTSITSDAYGNVFVVCQGNYADILPKVWKIDNAGNAKEFCEGSLIAVDKQENGSRTLAAEATLIVLNAVTDWSTGVTNITSDAYNTITGEQYDHNFITEQNFHGSPNMMDVNPSTGQIYICADASAFAYNDPGYVFVFNIEGVLLKTYNVGVHPYGVVFK